MLQGAVEADHRSNRHGLVLKRWERDIYLQSQMEETQFEVMTTMVYSGALVYLAD